MCRNCVKEEFPHRERLCSEKGIYIINFIGCHNCNETNRAPDSLLVSEYSKKNVEDEEDDVSKEIISFNHSCAKCGHIIAKHIHEFWIEDGYQEYRMECMLCGIGEDSVSVLPKDPRKVSQIPALF